MIHIRTFPALAVFLMALAGGAGNVQAGFVKNEIGASVFTVPPAGASGNWQADTPIPSDSFLNNKHFYAQVLFVDFGAPRGLACSGATDLFLCP